MDFEKKCELFLQKLKTSLDSLKAGMRQLKSSRKLLTKKKQEKTKMNATDKQRNYATSLIEKFTVNNLNASIEAKNARTSMVMMNYLKNNNDRRVRWTFDDFLATGEGVKMHDAIVNDVARKTKEAIAKPEWTAKQASAMIDVLKNADFMTHKRFFNNKGIARLVSQMSEEFQNFVEIEVA